MLEQMQSEEDEDDTTTTPDLVSVSSGRPVHHATRHNRKVSGDVSFEFQGW